MNNTDLTDLTYRKLTNAFVKATQERADLAPYISEYQRRSMLHEMLDKINAGYYD